MLRHITLHQLIKATVVLWCEVWCVTTNIRTKSYNQTYDNLKMQCKEWSDIMGYVRGTWLLKRVSKSYWCTCSCAGSRRYWSHFHRARSRCSGKNGGFQRKILVSAEVKKSRDWINHETIGELASFLGLNIRSVHFVHGLCLCMILCFFCR